MKTGAHLKVREFGTDALGVDLLGNPKYPEPVFFFVTFPGGRVEITRTSDNEYWIHITSNQPNTSNGDRTDERSLGRIIDARADRLLPAADSEIEHIAVRISCDDTKPSEVEEIHSLAITVTENMQADPLRTSPFK